MSQPPPSPAYEVFSVQDSKSPIAGDVKTPVSEFRFDHDIPDPIPSLSREIYVHREGMTGNLKLIPAGGTTKPDYFLRNSAFGTKTPDQTLFAGSDEHGPVVGVTNFVVFSTTINVGRGNPDLPHSVEWEAVSKEARTHRCYKFSTPSGREQDKSYLWKRTHDPNLNAPKLDMRSWKLQDEATGQVVAAFTSTKGVNWTRVGTFRLLPVQDEEWEEWILLTGLAVYGKARRRAMARRDLSWYF